jgi:ABC-type nickel/cobalt efflux system permease component RcnA
LQSSFWFRAAIIIFLVRLSVLIRTIKDASARSSSFWFQLLSVVLIIGFTPVFWLLLYIAIRPQWWKRDKTPRRDTLFQKSQICDNCGEFNQIDHLYCTSCWESLHISCRECQNKYSKSYSYCPKCWAPRLEE